MTGEEFRKFVSRYAEGVTKADLRGLMSCYAGGAVLYDAGNEFRGISAIQDLMQGYIRAFPDMVAKAERYFWAGDYGFVEWHFSGTHKGPMETPQGTVPATNKRVDFNAVAVLTFDSKGCIVEERDYYDSLALMQQLGLPIAKAA